MKKVALILTLAALAFGHAHYMAYAEDKCEELGNTPQQCALLAQQKGNQKCINQSGTQKGFANTYHQKASSTLQRVTV